MFGGKKDKDNIFASGGTTLLARSVEIIGDIKFGGNLEVEGVVTGNIYAQSETDARVRIMEKGEVKGEINAPKIVINGQVTGDVYSTKHIELAANAVVNGNVHYNVIEMVKGAEVNGNLVHVADKTDRADKPGRADKQDARIKPLAVKVASPELGPATNSDNT